MKSTFKKGYSYTTVSHNIAELIKGGTARPQAVAIALAAARSVFFKRYPQGALPEWLAFKSGMRMQNPVDIWDVLAEDFRGNVTLLDSFNSSSLANEFASYVERQQTGDRITVKKRAPAKRRKSNPVPPSSRSAHGTIAAQKGRAELLYYNFTGHDPSETQMIDKPVYPDVMSVIGDIDGVMYTTVRDGVTEKYIHKFKKNSRPLFCVAPDGQTLYMIGGSYEFGERGIVDK